MKFGSSIELGLLAAVLAAGASGVEAVTGGFVKTSGTKFVIDGCTTYFSGANTYYLTTGAARSYVDNAFSVYGSHSFSVLRTDAFCESTSGCGDGPFVTFDSSAKTISLSSTNLQRLDYAVATASSKNIRVILSLTNNWSDFGGMDAWVKGLGGTYHDDFYTSSTIKTQFKAYINGLVNRVNTVSGLTYKNDPAIFAWELANEPRCSNGGLSSSGSCSTSTITNWADEISKYIKSVDSNHLVAIGDEGFGLSTTSNPPSNTYVYQTSEGLDFKTNLALSNIDFGTFHMYPTGWGLSNIPTDGNEWIKAHTTVGSSVNKPVILEEFGLTDKSSRQTNYDSWYQTTIDQGVGAVLFWMLAGTDYSDYDGYTLYDSDITTLVDPWTKKIHAKNACSSSSSTTSSKTTTTSSSSKTTTTTTSTKTTTTTTTSKTTSSATSTASCAAKYGQCGGYSGSYTGPTCCQSGSTCTYSNAYYSQCL